MELSALLRQLRDYTQRPLLDGWFLCQAGEQVLYACNHRGHLAWSRGHQQAHFQRSFTLPTDWSGYPLAGKRLYLRLYWWASAARFWVNGVEELAGDLYDQRGRILLTESARPGMEFVVDAFLESPGHDDGALYHLALMLEHPDPFQDPGFLADELAVLQALALPGTEDLLAAACAKLCWLPEHTPEQLTASLVRVREYLKPLGAAVRAHRVNLLGHSHIDMAWLWPHRETLEVSERTFRSVLALQQDYPELLFVQSTAYLYAWIEQNRPELFAAIREQVQQGRWELVGGMWIEPDLNLPDGESLIRQVVYGKQYFQEKFGVDVRVGWNPDSFGYTWQLPQIYKKTGIDYFLTQKLLWNDTTTFPYQAFWWQGPDGSRVLTYFAPPLGEEIPPVKIVEQLKQVVDKTAHPELLWLYGVGDHGGGPTRDMLETQRRWRTSPFFPEIQYHSSLEFFRALEGGAAQFPVWTGELYLEFHRGAYTTHADQKQSNRRCEVLLTNVEKLLFLLDALQIYATPAGPVELEHAWKLLLFNQFHDILPGTAIPEVFSEANRAWDEVFGLGGVLVGTALEALSRKLNRPDILVVNLLNWPRTALLELSLPRPHQGSYRLVDEQGQEEAMHFLDDSTALARVRAVPAMGYTTYRLIPTEETLAPPLEPFTLENAYLRVNLDPETGDIQSLWDKVRDRELLTGPGNQLQGFVDKGQYWDAWNIDPDYAQKPLPPTQLLNIIPGENNPLRSSWRVIRQLGNSRITQHITLPAHAPTLTFTTEIDWQERHVLLKAAFPLALQSDKLVCEVPMAVLERPTQPQTPQEQAQWEVPALRWVAYEAEGQGIALLNDSKYGYDCTGSLLRLTLLRAPAWPDPEADRGLHTFTYQIYVYGGLPGPSLWRRAEVVRRGHELNNPLLVHRRPSARPAGSLDLKHFYFMEEDAAERSSLILTTTKPTAHGWVLRFYESEGRSFTTALCFARPLQSAWEVTLLEEPLHPLPVDDRRVSLTVGAWEIKSLRVVFVS
ncbi:alpha-mannosidase [Anthocerotibacter panamensis]|uniref:alpha-mannosidase n=1 Tax=Anthocerotibacter panamensis TaxID=2857077 RepID=UPI001C401B43|nr:alpha-mannosidase [Anthocerotibacter panamensis]